MSMQLSNPKNPIKMETSIAKTGSTAVDRPLKKVDILKSILNSDSVQEQFRNALKENSSAFVASVIDLYNSDNNLQKCEPKQLVMEALKAAVLKLPINKALGFAWIVPYNNSVKTDSGWEKRMVPTFQIGYRGYIQLAQRTGQYRFINADVVYEGELRSTNKLTGEIDLNGAKISDTVVGYFAYVEFISGFSKTLYMTKEKVTAHAKRFSKSFGGKSSPWETDFDAMALKTVLSHLLSHYGYLSVDMIGAIEADVSNETRNDDDIRMNANQGEVIEFSEVEEPQAATTVEVVNTPNTLQQQPAPLSPNAGF